MDASTWRDEATLIVVILCAEVAIGFNNSVEADISTSELNYGCSQKVARFKRSQEKREQLAWPQEDRGPEIRWSKERWQVSVPPSQCFQASVRPSKTWRDCAEECVQECVQKCLEAEIRSFGKEHQRPKRSGSKSIQKAHSVQRWIDFPRRESTEARNVAKTSAVSNATRYEAGKINS